jgi:hypothetical protein
VDQEAAAVQAAAQAAALKEKQKSPF